MMSRIAAGTRARKALTVVTMAFLAVSLTSLPPTVAIAGDQDDRGDRHDSASWSMSGQGIANWRFQPDEKKLNAHNVGSLTPAWVATLAGDISATPAVVDGAVYVPDWGGNVSKLDAKTGAVIWSKSVGALIGIPGSKSRTSPAVVGDAVIIGSQAGAYLFALDRKTGALRWKTQLDAHPAAVVTQSPTVHQGTIYVGVGSLEEPMVGQDPLYPCCTSGAARLPFAWRTAVSSGRGTPHTTTVTRVATPARRYGARRPPST